VNDLSIREYLLKKIEINSNNLTDSVSNAISNGIYNGINNLWDKIVLSINGSIDTIGLIGIMSTWILNMMSIQNAGKWCYNIVAFYIILKVVLICLLK